MCEALKQSQKELMPFVLEVFENNKTLDDLYQLGYSVMPRLHKDVVILTHNVDEFLAQREKIFPEELRRIVDSLERNPYMRPLIEKKKTEAIEKNNNFIQWFADRSPGKTEYESYMKEKLTIKSNNINLLQKLGITFKNEKKLSLNAAFKSVYGELLEPQGFKLLKSKYPYFVRVIDDEVIQIISFMKEKAFDHDYEGISICIGISLTNLPLINFDKNPMTIDNQCCMRDLISFYHDYSQSFDITQNSIRTFSFYYKNGNNDEMLNVLKESQLKLMPFVFDFFDSNHTLDNLYQLGLKFTFGCFDDVVILAQRIDEHLITRKKEFVNEIQRLTNVTFKNMPEMLEVAKEKSTERFFRINQWFVDRNIGGTAYEEYMKQANETKNENLAFFKKYL